MKSDPDNVTTAGFQINLVKKVVKILKNRCPPFPSKRNLEKRQIKATQVDTKMCCKIKLAAISVYRSPDFFKDCRFSSGGLNSQASSFISQ